MIFLFLHMIDPTSATRDLYALCSLLIPILTEKLLFDYLVACPI